jgi:Amt family ammonium transporter
MSFAHAASAAELSAGDTAWMLTPGCAFVTPIGSIRVGFGVSMICYAAVGLLEPAAGDDDSLDVFGVHRIGGMWGAIATGLFMAPFALPEGVTCSAQVGKQLTSVAFTAVYAPLVTVVILSGLKAVLGDLRVTEEQEWAGVDLSEHRETAYAGHQ